MRLADERNYEKVETGYQFEDNRTYFVSGNGARVQLANFRATICREEIHDSGAEKRRVLVVEGIGDNGQTLPVVRVPAERFSNMKWVMDEWGVRAVIPSGSGKADKLREAIQVLSPEIQSKTVYNHTGWRKIQGEWLYLHGNGAIGKEGNCSDIEVSLQGGSFQNFRFESVPSIKEVAYAVRMSLRLLDLAPKEISIPLLATTFRAPLGEVFRIDHSVFIVGPTGNQKSELTAIVQAHFGAGFSRLSLPGSWTSTPNALELQAFSVKDAVFTIDDFYPPKNAADAGRLNVVADRILRGQGNHTGRGRMNADGSHRPTYFARGMILTSGEDLPRGHSLRARAMILEVPPGAVDKLVLTELQAAAGSGVLADAMAGYLSWLASRIDDFKTEIPFRHRAIRDDVMRSISVHGRTPDIVASLMIGLECFLNFAQDTGAISQSEFMSLFELGRVEIVKAAKTQVGHLSSEDPTLQFFDLLRSAIDSGRAHLVDRDSGDLPNEPVKWGWVPSEGRAQNASGEYTEVGDSMTVWRPQGRKIGWVSEMELLFDPQATFATVQSLAREQGEAFTYTPMVLWKRLSEKGLCLSEAGKNLVKRTVAGGERPRLLVVSRARHCPL